MKRLVLILLLLAGIRMVIAGDWDRIEQPVIISFVDWNRPGGNHWAAGGAGIADPGQPLPALNNPAAIGPGRLSVYAEGEKRLTSDYFADLKIGGQWIAPACLGVSMRIGRLAFGAGYASLYDHAENAEIELTTIEEPMGSGEFITIKQRERLHNFFISAAWQPLSMVALGMTNGLTWYDEDESMDRLKTSGTGFGWMTTLGVRLQPANWMAFAFVYKYSSDIDVDFETRGALRVIDVGQAGDGTQFYSSTFKDTRKAQFPYEFEFGFTLFPLKNFILSGKMNVRRWHHQSYPDDETVNFHGGLHWQVSSALRASVGFFTAYYPGTVTDNVLDQKFLTGGLSLKAFGRSQLSITVLSSAPFVRRIGGNDSFPHKETYSQTVFKMGLNVPILMGSYQ